MQTVSRIATAPAATIASRLLLLAAVALLAAQLACTRTPAPPDLVVATPNQLQVWTWDRHVLRYTPICSTAKTGIRSLATMDSLVYASDSRTILCLTPNLKVIHTWTCDTQPKQWIPASGLVTHDSIVFVRASQSLIALGRALDSLGSVDVGQTPYPADLAFIGDTAFIVSTYEDDGIALVDVRDPTRLRLLGLLESGVEMSTASGRSMSLWLNPGTSEAGLVRAGAGCMGGSVGQGIRRLRIPHDSFAWPNGPYRDELSPRWPWSWRGYTGGFRFPRQWDDDPTIYLPSSSREMGEWEVYANTHMPPLWVLAAPKNATDIFLCKAVEYKDTLQLVVQIQVARRTEAYSPAFPASPMVQHGPYLYVQVPGDYLFSPGRLVILDTRGKNPQMAYYSMDISTFALFSDH